MKAAMKAMKAKSVKAMPKTGIADSLANSVGLKRSECAKALDALAKLGASEVKKNGKFTIPGLVMVKTKVKPATQAGTKMMFGQSVKVKAMKARTVVKALAVSAIKKNF